MKAAVTNIAKKIFGTQNERELKSLRPLVNRVNDLEKEMKALSDDGLLSKSNELKERVRDRGESLDSVMPEAFALVREGAWRKMGMRHYDVQLIGGATLHRGRIAEMKTGEGKTLVATLPMYLNALSGKGTHLVTVNDYLARRDAEWMGQVYKFLGMKVGIIVHGLNDRERQEAYGADITYGTNNEFGFDYLRDNMKFDLKHYVQREHNFAIVDEVDSILIDEARTPLIISGPTEDSTDLYYKIDEQIRKGGGLTPETHYNIDEKMKTATLTEAGVEEMEKRLSIENLYDPVNIEFLHHVNQGLRAHVLFKNDVDYVVRDNEVVIVDEFTGRMMPGRRWSDGLHQAIEAKEGVSIENENQTLASITFQNYFRMYDKLAGMTGTADTEATEFDQIYKLKVTVIPTNKPIARLDEADVIYKTKEQKYKGICEEIIERHQKGQPILVGTVSVENSEIISRVLKQQGIKHDVLNAKQHAREADVVAQAGRLGSVTIATNMAGRGTDIVLGGNPDKLAEWETGPVDPSATAEEKEEYDKQLTENVSKWTEKCSAEKQEVLDAGGLFILGTERHESRRIDNQLRGRSGRQGDPGGSRFFLSLDDDLMRIFGGNNIKKWMEDDVAIEHRFLTRAIEKAQKRVESQNYDSRKHVLKYDDVMNQQRKVIYGWRKAVLAAKDAEENIFQLIEELSEDLAADFFPGGKLPKKEGRAFLDEKELNEAIQVNFQIPSNISEKDISPLNDNGLMELLKKMTRSEYDQRVKDYGEGFKVAGKHLLLDTIDKLWKDHLLAMDSLREGIGLRGYGQKDPLVEYKKEGYRFFEMMMKGITSDVIMKYFALRPAGEIDVDRTFHQHQQQMEYNVDDSGDLVNDGKFLPPSPEEMGLPPGVDPSQIPPEMLEQMAEGGAIFNQPQGGGGGGHSQPGMGGLGPGIEVKPVESGVPKVGRNDPCPCGSGKKYKKCHGK